MHPSRRGHGDTIGSCARCQPGHKISRPGPPRRRCAQNQSHEEHINAVNAATERSDELVSSYFICCHFEPGSLVLSVKEPRSLDFQDFNRWPRGQTNTRLPSFIADTPNEPPAWGFESKKLPRLGPFDELLDLVADGFSPINEEDAVQVFSKFLQLVSAEH